MGKQVTVPPRFKAETKAFRRSRSAHCEGQGTPERHSPGALIVMPAIAISLEHTLLPGSGIQKAALALIDGDPLGCWVSSWDLASPSPALKMEVQNIEMMCSFQVVWINLGSGASFLLRLSPHIILLLSCHLPCFSSNSTAIKNWVNGAFWLVVL